MLGSSLFGLSEHAPVGLECEEGVRVGQSPTLIGGMNWWSAP